jgi:hypothetical protein
MERGGKGAAKRKIVRNAKSSESPSKTPAPAGKKETGALDARAELTRTISELNEVQMRLDAIVRRLAESAVAVEGAETAADMEKLRLRLLGKLDRIREQLVARLGEERKANVH